MFRSVLALIFCLLISACGGKTSGSTEVEAEKKNETTQGDLGRYVGLAGIDAWLEENPISKDLEGWKTRLRNPIHEVKLDPAIDYQWRLTTDRGEMLFDLFEEYAPLHVINTAYLSHVGFYDGISFHRVMTGFMAQGGCPLGNGTGGPGYYFHGEFHPENPGHARRGMLSMANTGKPKTDGSQFFITFGPVARLNPDHTVFGYLISGEDTLKRLELVASESGTPKSNVKILKAEVIEKAR